MSQSVLQAPVRGWMWLVILGPILTIIGIVVGLTGTGNMCGSVFAPESRVAQYYDSMGGFGGATRACEKSIVAAAVPTWILIVLGIVFVLMAILLRAIGKNRTPGRVEAPAAPSVASQIEDLARLKDKGFIDRGVRPETHTSDAAALAVRPRRRA